METHVVLLILQNIVGIMYHVVHILPVRIEDRPEQTQNVSILTKGEYILTYLEGTDCNIQPKLFRRLNTQSAKPAPHETTNKLPTSEGIRTHTCPQTRDGTE